MKPSILPAALAATILAAPGSAATFVFDYLDGPGVGFNDPVEGPARRGALELAGAVFASSVLAEYDAEIVIETQGDTPSGSGFLAAAGSYLVDLPGGGIGRHEVVRNKLLSGGASDLNGTDADALLLWNFADWSFELDPSENSYGFGVYDFFSTALHEFTHVIGWLSGMIEPEGSDVFGDGTAAGGIPGEWTAYDRYVTDAAGAPLIDDATFLNTVSDMFLDIATTGASPAAGLFFAGPNAMAANGGEPVGLYTPATYAPGSSISHLDDENPAYAGMIMNAFILDGPGTRDYSALELAVLRDLGYADIRGVDPTVLAPVPLPGALPALASGIVLLGVLARRKRA